MLVTPAATSRSATTCAACTGVAITAMLMWCSRTTVIDIVDVVHHQTIDALAHPGRVRVEQRGEPEAARGEPAYPARACPRLPTPTSATARRSVSPSTDSIWSTSTATS